MNCLRRSPEHGGHAVDPVISFLHPKETPFSDLLLLYTSSYGLVRVYSVHRSYRTQRRLIEMDFGLKSLWYASSGIVDPYPISLLETFYIPTTIIEGFEIFNPNILADQPDDEVLGDVLVGGFQPTQSAVGFLNPPIVDQSAMAPQSKPASHWQKRIDCPLCSNTYSRKQGMLRHLQSRLLDFP